jgi:hypothetical protein
MRKTCVENQHIFISFAFDTFSFLALEPINLLKIGQKNMHNNIMSSKSMSVMFQIEFCYIKKFSGATCCLSVVHV